MKALEIENLTKIYPGGIRAVDSVSFSVDEGEIFGLLGPNGAGKTTTIKMIMTLSRPAAGRISVFGLDAISKTESVREMVGYVPQAVSVDGDLTGYENLLIFSKLSYIGKSERKQRIGFALKYMGLLDRAHELVKRYSGGMMRRLEIAQALVNEPRLLILDEPSIGLDPASKRQMWDHLKRMNRELGTTILITTHDMAEADELCDRIAIMNEGRIAVIGSPYELKESVGGEVVSLKIAERNGLGGSLPQIPEEIGKVVGLQDSTITVSVKEAERRLPALMEFMLRNGVSIESITFRKPSLDDVFLKYAKVTFEQGGAYSRARVTRRLFARRSR